MTSVRRHHAKNARQRCKEMSADLPIIKSQPENDFILSLMKEQYVWLGMERNKSGFFWFDGSPAEPSHGALYSAWKNNELERGDWMDEKCAFLELNTKKWRDHHCIYKKNIYVLCQKRRAWSGWVLQLFKKINKIDIVVLCTKQNTNVAYILIQIRNLLLLLLLIILSFIFGKHRGWWLHVSVGSSLEIVYFLPWHISLNWGKAMKCFWKIMKYSWQFFKFWISFIIKNFNCCKNNFSTYC